MYKISQNIQKLAFFNEHVLANYLSQSLVSDQLRCIAIIWDKVFESGVSKFYGRQPLKNFKVNRPYPLKFCEGCLHFVTCYFYGNLREKSKTTTYLWSIYFFSELLHVIIITWHFSVLVTSWLPCLLKGKNFAVAGGTK